MQPACRRIRVDPVRARPEYYVCPGRVHLPPTGIHGPVNRFTSCLAIRGLLLLAVLGFAAGVHADVATAAVREARRQRAEALWQSAERRLAARTIEARRAAIADLEQAMLLDPDSGEIALSLARACYTSGFLLRSRVAFQHALELAPNDAEARLGLAQIWRRDWLKYLERRSLDLSVEHFAAAVRLDPRLTDAWLMLASLRIEQGDLVGARAAATGALAAEPSRVEAWLALGSARWRLGEVAGADSAFRAALPGLRRSLRTRLEDIAPLATAADTAQLSRLADDDAREFRRRFWALHDPDPTTPENEAQLEYRARVTQAYFLFYDPRRREWDERGEVYVRYGPPGEARYNPVGTHLWGGVGTRGTRLFPMNVLAWDYPALGMNVVLQDRILSEYYLFPQTTDEDPDPRPDPDSLARQDLLASTDGRAVFPIRAPGLAPLPLSGQLARFESGGGGRLFAGVEVEATPAESLQAEWAVLDSAGVALARGASDLSPAPCAAGDRRVASFARELPPGHYLVGLSVHGRGRRGVLRLPVDVAAPGASLGVSDLVVSCGVPEVGARSVRLEANPAGRIARDAPLVAYFEVYRLQPDSAGTARLAYSYAVYPERGRRSLLQRVFQPHVADPLLAGGREGEQAGGLRRQYVSVPLGALPAGGYVLEIEVADRLTGERVSRRAHFQRLSTP